MVCVYVCIMSVHVRVYLCVGCVVRCLENLALLSYYLSDVSIFSCHSSSKIWHSHAHITHTHSHSIRTCTGCGQEQQGPCGVPGGSHGGRQDAAQGEVCMHLLL